MGLVCNGNLSLKKFKYLGVAWEGDVEVSDLQMCLLNTENK